MYVVGQESMPPADAAVRIAKILDTAAAYLVTGEESNNHAKSKDFA